MRSKKDNNWILASLVGGAFFILLAVTTKAATPFDTLRATTVRLINGSGSIVQGRSGRTYLLTNFHVCLGAKIDGEVVGFFPDGSTSRGPVVEEDPEDDLCLVRVPGRAALVPAEHLSVGQHVFTRGYPMGILGEFEGTVGKTEYYGWSYEIGEIGECPKGTERELGHNGRLYSCRVNNANTVTTLYAAPGSSGSPVVDEYGQLVGVIASHLHTGNTSNGAAGMVPIKAVQGILARH